VTEAKKPTNFYITKEADTAGKEIIKESGNMNSLSEMVPLAVTLVILDKNESHLNIDEEDITVHKGRLNDLENHEALAELYKSTFIDSNPDEVWKNFQKAASAGIMLIHSKYFTHQKLIDWESINQDLL
jgi:hypothetical protein